MTLTWNDFVWMVKNWNRVRRSTPPSGAYTITANDYSLIANLSSASTWTLPTPVGAGQVLKIKNKSIYDLTLSGTIFTDQTISELILLTGDMVTLSDDGSCWSVGD